MIFRMAKIMDLLQFYFN